MTSPAVRERGPFQEYVRGDLLESAANTFSELEIKTPVGRSINIAMLLHSVMALVGLPDIEDGQSNLTQVALYDRTRTSIPTPDVSGLLWFQDYSNNYGVVAGTLTEFSQTTVRGDSPNKLWQPPVLYAKDALFLGIVGSGNANPKRVQIQVGYTLGIVTPEEFIAALVE